MNVRESVGIALDALRANKLRSFLTLIGVIIGVSSVITVMSVVQGLDRYVRQQLVSSGANVFSIDRVGIEFDFRKVTEKLRRRRLTAEDAGAIARAASHVLAVVATRDGSSNVKRGDRQLRRVQIHGAEPDYMVVEDYPVAKGRPLEDRDQLGRASVCVIGSEAADDLFGPLDPVGRDLRVGDASLTVVGVGARKGSSFGQSQDQYIIIPLSTFEKLYGREGSVTIQVRSQGQDVFETAQDEARSILRQRRHVAPGQPDDFDLITPDMYLGLWRSLSGAIFVVIVGVSMISLVVGGIVIMNIMLVSVTERTREIGIRKALGARSKDVLAQFLIEATTLSMAGGLIGLTLGVGLALFLGLITPLPTFVSPLAVALGLVSSTAVGIFFGAYPAARASRLDPIEALRHE
jgi:putative ABC transport system permease protein